MTMLNTKCVNYVTYFQSFVMIYKIKMCTFTNIYSKKKYFEIIYQIYGQQPL